MKSVTLPGKAGSVAVQPELVTIMQELAIVANEPVSTADAIRMILDVLGRHLGLLSGRVLSMPDSSFEGETDFTWTKPGTPQPPCPPHSLWADDDLREDWVGRIARDAKPVVIRDVRAEDEPEAYLKSPSFDYSGYLAYPLQVVNGVVGIVEFYTTERLPEALPLRDILAHGATLIGLVIERGRSQARLRESERRFRGIFDHSYQFIGLLQPDGTLVEVNETALAFGGLTSDEVVGRKFWDTYWWRASPATQKELRQAIERAAAGEFVRYDATIQGAGGQMVVVDFSIKPLLNRKGQVVLLISEGRDITRLKQMVESLRLTELRLEEAQRIAHIGHWDYDIATEQASWSDTLYDIFDLNPDTTAVTSHTFLDRVHPEDRQILQNALERSFTSGRPFELHFRILRPDGLVRTVFSAGGPVKDDAGHPARMAGIVQDVTGRHQLEVSLAHSVERLSGLNAMGQAVASSLDLDSIYRLVLSTGRSLLNTDAVILFLREGDELYIAAVDQEEGLALLGRRIPTGAGIAGEAWTTGHVVWLSGEECRRRRSANLANASGFDPGAIIAVPVRWQDEILGVLEAADSRDDAFSVDDVKMLQAVANWTAIAIGKTRQHEFLERRLKESEAIAFISRALSETLEPESTLQLIVDKAHEIVPRSDWAVVHLLRGRPERLDPVAFAGAEVDLSDYVIGKDEGIAGLVMKEGELINVADTRLDPRASSYAQASGLRSLLVAPIQTRNRRLGTISLHCMQPSAFTEEDERLLTILTVQAGLAVENAHLFDSQRRARLVAELQRERLRALTDRIVTTQEEERLRISRELHDEAGQALTSLKISLDLLRGSLPFEQEALRDRLADLSALTGETMETLRTLAHDLRPPGLDTFGLNVALESLCHDFAARTEIDVTYCGTDLPELPTTLALSLYRFSQEALTNVAKHAEARHVSVVLAMLEGEISLTIADDGKGFTYDPNAGQNNGIGLMSMQERTDLLGGRLEVETRPGQGVRLTARVPLEFGRRGDED